MTGKNSIFTRFENLDIMFHVSTMLPFTPDEDQQLSRKRHLGNDIVVIIFLDGDGDFTFNPSTVQSYFNHVFFVVQKDAIATTERGHTVYRYPLLTLPSCWILLRC